MSVTTDAEVRASAPVDALLLMRIRAEFREMPGLCLTASQARRLWALERAKCDSVLAALLQDGFLRRTSDGSFVRADLV